MTLICGVPFAEGIAVAADRATAHPPLQKRKLLTAGGRLFSLSGGTDVITRDGRLAFALENVILAIAPDRVEPQDLHAFVPKVAERAARSWPTTRDGLEQGALCVFWFPSSFSSFTLHKKGPTVTHSQVTEHPVDPARPRPYILQGMDAYAKQHVIDGLRLSRESYAFIVGRRPVRDVSQAQAEAFARDVIESSERTMKIIPPPIGRIGDGVDVEIVRRAPTEAA